MLLVQVTASLLLLAGVLFFMWRLPKRSGAHFRWAPPLALLSPWAGLAAVLASALLWVVSQPDPWVAAVLLVLGPLSIGTGILVLWMYRRIDDPPPAALLHRLQARVGIGLGLLAVALGYAFVLTHKTPFTPVGL